MAERAGPVRTCVGCRERSSKELLIRVARQPAGDVIIDREGRAPGRGAYVHEDAACIRRAVRGGFLARGLRTGLEPAQVARLWKGLTEELGERP